MYKFRQDRTLKSPDIEEPVPVRVVSRMASPELYIRLSSKAHLFRQSQMIVEHLFVHFRR